MAEFGFRLQVRLAPGQRLRDDRASLVTDLPLPIGGVSICAEHAQSISTAEWISFTGRGHATAGAAKDAGVALRTGLRVVASRVLKGIDVGNDTVLSGVGALVRDAAADGGDQVINEVHGLQVFEVWGQLRFLSVRADASVCRDLALVIDDVADAVSAGVRLARDEALACDLLALSHFEAGPAARLITATTAGEVLARRTERGGRCRELVEQFIQATENAMQESDSELEELRSLRSAVLDLRKRSIASSFRSLSSEVPERQDAEQILRAAYKVRSLAVHEGRTEVKDSQLIGQLQFLLGEIVALRARPTGLTTPESGRPRS